jgi:hypothetical protein
MSDIKTINISGEAAAAMNGGGLKKGRRSTKKNQSGGATEEAVRGVSPVMNLVRGVESNSSVVSAAASTNSSTWLKYPTDAPVPPKINFTPAPSHVPSSADKSAAPTNQYTTPQQGGAKHVKVELKKKTTAKKVHLNPKKQEAAKSSRKHQTRKVRKVTLGVSSLHKRITRAKKLHKKMKEMPIDTLKEKLVKGGLIKANSKAPENVLRQIAADAEVVKNKAL